MIDWPTYNELRAAANAESLSYGELITIQTAFDEVPEEQLSDRREYALADDMLDEIATFLSHGHPVFVTDDGIVPTCDHCSGPQLAEGDDWNGETGCHKSCEAQASEYEALVQRVLSIADMDGSAADTCQALYELADELRDPQYSEEAGT